MSWKQETIILVLIGLGSHGNIWLKGISKDSHTHAFNAVVHCVYINVVEHCVYIIVVEHCLY